jgi:hypothetical protein
MEIFAEPRNKRQFQRGTKLKFYFDAKAENVRANRSRCSNCWSICCVTQMTR